MGVYRRWVVDEDGLRWRILVPRYLCRRRGPLRGGDRTFSVLPACLVPRRRWALSLGLKVAGWYRGGLSMVLDALGDLGLAFERLQVLRIMAVLAVGCERLRQHPLDGVHVETSGSRLAQAVELARLCRDWERSGRGPPSSVVMAWQRRFGKPLLAIRLT
jgi:hypothetical protein